MSRPGNSARLNSSLQKAKTRRQHFGCFAEEIGIRPPSRQRHRYGGQRQEHARKQEASIELLCVSSLTPQSADVLLQLPIFRNGPSNLLSAPHPACLIDVRICVRKTEPSSSAGTRASQALILILGIKLSTPWCWNLELGDGKALQNGAQAKLLTSPLHFRRTGCPALLKGAWRARVQTLVAQVRKSPPMLCHLSRSPTFSASDLPEPRLLSVHWLERSQRKSTQSFASKLASIAA